MADHFPFDEDVFQRIMKAPAELITFQYRPPIMHPCKACGEPAVGWLCSKCADSMNSGDSR